MTKRVINKLKVMTEVEMTWDSNYNGNVGCYNFRVSKTLIGYYKPKDNLLVYMGGSERLENEYEAWLFLIKNKKARPR